MHFVTLTTDWNKDDFYTGTIKGTILSSCDHTEIVTISNKIKPFNIAEAAFVIRNSYHHFPKGSIHILAVGTPEPDGQLLIAKANDHYFLTVDNGIIGLLGDPEPVEVTGIIRPSGSDVPATFPALTVFAKAACDLINGKKLSEIGNPVEDYKKQIPLRATLENNIITGTVIYIDSYGNAITNITRELFDRIGKERKFNIYVQSKHYKIFEIKRYYSDTTPGDLLAVFNSVDLLEIAIRNGSAANLLNLNTDSTIRVEFIEK